MPKKRLLNRKKLQQKPRPRNRYVRNAKLSEYKFLKLLRGFAVGAGPKSLAKDTGISEKTIRATYGQLRQKVGEAIMSGQPLFGIGARYFFERGELTEKGRIFMEAVAQSSIFRAYKSVHAPRMTDQEGLHALTVDLAMRIFSGLVVADEEFTSLTPGLRRAFEQLIVVKIWIEENEGKPGFIEEHGDTITRHQSLMRMALIVQEQREIIALRQSPKHRYANDQFYNDLRRFLLASPM